MISKEKHTHSHTEQYTANHDAIKIQHVARPPKKPLLTESPAPSKQQRYYLWDRLLVAWSSFGQRHQQPPPTQAYFTVPPGSRANSLLTEHTRISAATKRPLTLSP